jgi:ABC-type bacteriocin/lantibiotic exporter with double-glycine peptidase domain
VSPERRRIVPEVLQSSSMDCGPAALSAVLAGFDIPSDYDTVRARCQTDVDGTSIYDLSKLAGEMGLEASQVLVSRDSLLLSSAGCLPAIVVVSEVAGLLHFVVVWDTSGPLVQVMDPSTGRRWETRQRFLARLPDVPVTLSVERFARWRKTRYASEPLTHRLCRLGFGRESARGQVDAACSASGWREYATLDAAVRMVDTLVEGKAIARGNEARRLLTRTVEDAKSDGIPITFWWIWEGDSPTTLTVRGAPIVRFARRAPPKPQPLGARRTLAAPRTAAARTSTTGTPTSAPKAGAARGAERGVGAPFAAHLARHGLAPARLCWHLLTVELPSGPWLMAFAVALGALLALLDLLLLQGLMHAARHLTLTYQRIGGVLSVLGLSLAGLGVDWALTSSVARLGRRLEVRMRGALFERLPQLPDEYLRTRPTADMAQRGHALHQLHDVPLVARRALESFAMLAASAAGIAWLYPESTPWVLGAAAASVALPWLFTVTLAERSQRAHSHLIALDRFYLDALVGVIPIRVHGAERAVRRQHEALLVEWKRAMQGTLGHATVLQALLGVLGLGLSVVLVAGYSSEPHGVSGVLLLVYWADRIRVGGAAFMDNLVAYDFMRHDAIRLFAPFTARANPMAPRRAAGLSAHEAPEKRSPERSAQEVSAQEVSAQEESARAPLALHAASLADPTPATVARLGTHGMAVAFENVSVSISNRSLLRDIEVAIPPGQHLAIVGPSGAGKSSLVGLLLGWLTPSRGRVLLDGETLDARTLAAARAETVWLDPTVQLWNDTLLENVLYGADGAVDRLPEALEATRLIEVLEALPDGLRTEVGEGGARLSGGQGQRVRLARGWMHQRPRLVILDEPFRGLERPAREELLRRLRARFEAATLVFISHDIRDTRTLDRVLVIESGHLVEDGHPARLLAQSASRYRALLCSDERQKDAAWRAGDWRHARMQAGQLVETE